MVYDQNYHNCSTLLSQQILPYTNIYGTKVVLSLYKVYAILKGHSVDESTPKAEEKAACRSSKKKKKVKIEQYFP
jgi:hypothetical protein